MRKTINVIDFKNKINELLADEKLSDQVKDGLCTSLEIALHATNNYAGFQYNYWKNKGCSEWYAAGKPEGIEKNQYIYGDQGQYNRFYY